MASPLRLSSPSLQKQSGRPSSPTSPRSQSPRGCPLCIFATPLGCQSRSCLFSILADQVFTIPKVPSHFRGGFRSHFPKRIQCKRRGSRAAARLHPICLLHGPCDWRIARSRSSTPFAGSDATLPSRTSRHIPGFCIGRTNRDGNSSTGGPKTHASHTLDLTVDSSS